MARRLSLSKFNVSSFFRFTIHNLHQYVNLALQKVTFLIFPRDQRFRKYLQQNVGPS